MSINVVLDLPAELEAKLRRESVNLSDDVKRVYALELFRRGDLTHYQLSATLGLDRVETDAFLLRSGVFDNSLSMDDIDADRRALEQAQQKSSR
jgi:hypothetical protein